MENRTKKFLAQMKEFLEPSSKTTAINLRQHQLKHTILKAQKEQLALHAIYQNGSFTGELVRYDLDKGQIVLKNISKKITAIIPLKTIHRLSIVPSAINQAQK